MLEFANSDTQVGIFNTNTNLIADLVQLSAGDFVDCGGAV